jgi:hypothetical protein
MKKSFNGSSHGRLVFARVENTEDTTCARIVG